MKRVREYIVNFIFNGIIFFGAFSLAIFLFAPHSLYFDYESVEVNNEFEQFYDSGQIRMFSLINYNRSRDPFRWNDELRCNYDFDENGYFEYVGEWDTGSQSPAKKDQQTKSPWIYHGIMPDAPALCFMQSTITKLVYGFIPVKETVVSKPFTLK